MGSGPLDHPRLLEIEERLDRAEIDTAQRLLAELGDVHVHRVAITYEAEAEEKTSETIIQKIFDELPVP